MYVTPNAIVKAESNCDMMTAIDIGRPTYPTPGRGGQARADSRGMTWGLVLYRCCTMFRRLAEWMRRLGLIHEI